MADRAEPDRREAFLIGRVVAHDDHDAFAELVRLHQTPIRQFLRRLTGGDRETADDLAQETFWRAYRHLSTFEARGRLLSWLFRIAFQLFVSDRRSRRIAAVPLPPDLAGADGRGAARHRPTDDRSTDDAPGAERACRNPPALPARDEPPGGCRDPRAAARHCQDVDSAWAPAPADEARRRTGGRIMNDPRDEAIDTLLKSALAMEPLADGVFTQGVMDLIGRRRRQRRALLTAGWVSAGAIGLGTFPVAPAAWAAVAPTTLAAMMVLFAISSLVWTATAE